MAHPLLIPAHRTILRGTCLLQRFPGLGSRLDPWLRSTARTTHHRLTNRPRSLVRRSPLLSKVILRAHHRPVAPHIPPLARRSPTQEVTTTFTNSRSPSPAGAIRPSRTTITHRSHGFPAGGRLHCLIVRRRIFLLPFKCLRVSVAITGPGSQPQPAYGQQTYGGPSFPSAAPSAPLGFGLDPLDKIVGRRTREQLEGAVDSLAQCKSRFPFRRDRRALTISGVFFSSEHKTAE